MPTPEDRIAPVPVVSEAPPPEKYPAVSVTRIDSGLTVIRAARAGSPTVGLALASRMPHPLETGAFEARELAQAMLVEQSPLKRYGFSGESAPRGVAVSAEVLGPDARTAMSDLVDALRANHGSAELLAELKFVHGLQQLRRTFAPRLVAREYVLARLFNADAALTVARQARATFLDGLSHGELATLVHDLYAADHTALCVVGDEKYTDALVAAARTLPLAPKSEHLPEAFVQPTPEPNTVYVGDMGSHQAYLAAAGVAPLATDADFAAMWLLERLIGGMFTSAMNLELRERRTLTYQAHSSLLTSQAFGAWLFEAAIDGNQVLETLNAISELFDRIWQHISADDFLRARVMAVADLEARLESTGELLAWLTWRFQQGLEATDVRGFVERVRALSREDVQRVARIYLSDKLGPIVIVGASSHIRAQLQWSDYRVLDVADGTAKSRK